MAARRPRAHRERIRTDALLLRAVPFGEADIVATLFTETRGVISAVARSARRSIHRFPSLEPMHLLWVAFEERPGADIVALMETTISRSRIGLTESLARLEAAGTALRWVRRAASPNTPDPVLWGEINALLDALEASPADLETALLAAGGLRILRAVGWGLELERCVRCGRECAPGGSALVDPTQGGLVCRSCGGGPVLLRGGLRGRLLAVSAGDLSDLGALVAGGPDEVRAASELVDAVFAAHTR